jgi:hypothetical protein
MNKKRLVAKKIFREINTMYTQLSSCDNIERLELLHQLVVILEELNDCVELLIEEDEYII